jgi:5-formyltetrahydrofolate cyclo-ligase
MPESLENTKQQLRTTCRRLRLAQAEEQRALASLTVCTLISTWEIFTRADVILSYMPIKGEVDLRPLLSAHPSKTWLLPRILPGPEPALVFHPYQPGQLERHTFGMLEPVSHLPIIPPDQIELALIPGLAFDRAGSRLGYGGGYYDRCLGTFKAIRLGVTFAALLLQEVPRGEHDVPMQWLISEQGLIVAQP